MIKYNKEIGLLVRIIYYGCLSIQLLVSNFMFWDKITDFNDWLSIRIVLPSVYTASVYIVFPLFLLLIAYKIFARPDDKRYLYVLAAGLAEINWWYMRDIIPDTVYARMMKIYSALDDVHQQLPRTTYIVNKNDLEFLFKIDMALILAIVAIMFIKFSVNQNKSVQFMGY